MQQDWRLFLAKKWYKSDPFTSLSLSNFIDTIDFWWNSSIVTILISVYKNKYLFVLPDCEVLKLVHDTKLGMFKQKTNIFSSTKTSIIFYISTNW